MVNLDTKSNGNNTCKNLDCMRAITEQENNSNTENYAGRPTHVGQVGSYTGMHEEGCRSETVISKENPFYSGSPGRLSQLFFEKSKLVLSPSHIDMFR